MAGDWIKMRTDLYRDPKVLIIADSLMDGDGELARYVNQNMQRNMTVTRNVMRNVTVGALVSVWGVCRQRGKRVGDDLFVPRVTLSLIDDIADLPGFGEAMELSGWVTADENGLTFRRFFEDWNVDPLEEARRKNAERQRRYRESQPSKSNVTVTLKSNDRVEKRREEKEDNCPDKPGTVDKDELKAKDKAASPAKAKPDKPVSRKPDELFDAVAEVTASDPKVSGSHIGRVCKALRSADPPYTPAEVRRFAAIAPGNFAWHKGQLTLGMIEKYIGIVRAKTGKDTEQEAEAIRSQAQREEFERMKAEAVPPEEFRKLFADAAKDLGIKP